MKKICILCVLTIFAISCSKKTELIKLEEPKFLAPLESLPIKVFKTPDAAEHFHTSRDLKSFIEFDGILRLIPQNADTVENFYFQIHCPAEWKCDDGKAFVKRNEVILDADFKYGQNVSYGIPSVIIDKKDLDLKKPTVDFLIDEKSEFPKTPIDPKIFKFWIGNGARFSQINQIKAFVDLIKFKKLDPRYAILTQDKDVSVTLKKAYSIQEESELNDYLAEFSKSPLDNDSQKLIDEKLKLEREILFSTLFHVESTWKQIAEQFNALTKNPYAQEIAFQKIIETGQFNIDGRLEYSFVGKTPDKNISAATWKLEIKTGEGVYLTENLLSGTPIKSEIIGLKANPNPDSLTFIVSTTGGDLNLTTVELPKVFDGAEKLKKIISEIPKNYKEIIDQNYKDPQTAAILVALKFGKGGYDRSLGEYVYKVDDINAIIYQFKNNSIILANDDTFIEEMDYNLGGDLKLTKWYQRYDKETKMRSVFIDYAIEGCARECYLTKYPDNLCFRSGDILEVRFSPLNLFSAAGESVQGELEDVKFSSTGKPSEYCFAPLLGHGPKREWD